MHYMGIRKLGKCYTYLISSTQYPTLASMEEWRMSIDHVKLDSRRLGDNLLLLPFAEVWLSSQTCRDKKNVLDNHLDRPTALVTAEVIQMFCIMQQDTVIGSSRNARVDVELANATTCIYMKVFSVIYGFSTLYFGPTAWATAGKL